MNTNRFPHRAGLAMLAASLILLSACDKPSPSPSPSPQQAAGAAAQAEPGVLAVVENSKYKLACVFKGERTKLENGNTVDAVNQLAIRSLDGATPRDTPFVPEDPDSLETSFGYFREVWSPDREWLLLPLGRMEGFAILKSSADIPALLAAKRYHTTLRVEATSGTKLWHEFEGWDGNTIRFNVGLSGTKTSVRYNLADPKPQVPATMKVVVGAKSN